MDHLAEEILMANPLASLPLVCVVWIDAALHGVGDYTKEAAMREFTKDDVYKTFGLLICEDDEKVLVASDECVSEPGYRGFNRIPRGMVREVIHLPTPRRASKQPGGRRGPVRTPPPTPPASPDATP